MFDTNAEIAKMSGTKDDVLVFTEDNFDAQIMTHSAILVDFYSPNCPHCQHLAPEYAKAAQTLKDQTPPHYVAKVDCTEAIAIGGTFDPEGG